MSEFARDVLLSGRTAEDRVNAGPRRTWSDSVKGIVHSFHENVTNLQHTNGGSGDILYFLYCGKVP